MSTLLLGEVDDEGGALSTVPMLVDEGGSRPSEGLLHIMMPYISKQKSEGFDVHAPPWRGRRRGVSIST